MRDSKRDTDVQNSLLDSVGEGEGGMNWEFGIDIYTPLCIKQITHSLSLFTFMHWRRKWQPTLVFLPGESQGRGSLVGCCLWGHTESDTTEVTQQQQQQQQQKDSYWIKEKFKNSITNYFKTKIKTTLHIKMYNVQQKLHFPKAVGKHSFICLCYLKRMIINKTGIHLNKLVEN